MPYLQGMEKITPTALENDTMTDTNDATVELAFQIMFNALSIVVETPETAMALRDQDPAAMAQIERAIETAVHVAATHDENLVAPFDGNVPNQARSTVPTYRHCLADGRAVQVTVPPPEGA